MSHRVINRSLIVALSILCVGPAMAQFGVPPMINCQGILTDDTGVPLPGPVPVVFAIWDDPATGDSLWSEMREINPDDLGRFDVLLGLDSPIPDSAFGEGAFLSIQVVGFSEMAPRQHLVSVAYAYKAGLANLAIVSMQAAPWSVNSEAIIDETIELQDIGDNGAAEGQVIKRGPGGWMIADDATGGGPIPDEDWMLDSDVLYTIGGWGIARRRNTLYGIHDSTHINFGVACTTGAAGADWRYAVVSGGFVNVATNDCATVSGGRDNQSRGEESVICGGRGNQAMGGQSFIGGGWFNEAHDGENTIGGGSYNIARSRYSTISGGSYNETDAPSGLHANAAVGGGHQNKAMHQFATVAGGGYNQATGFRSTIGGGMHNRADDTASVVCGGGNNYARGRYSAIVGGGGDYTSTDSNAALGDWSFVGGGNLNVASGRLSTVLGGQSNHARGGRSVVAGGGKAGVDTNSAIGDWSFIGSGYGNIAKGFGSVITGGLLNSTIDSYSTVCGGTNNIAAGVNSTVAGGEGNFARGSRSFVGGGGGDYMQDTNSASGDWSVIPGGRRNIAAGQYSFAAGYRAQAKHFGSWVWADGTDADFASTANNQFLIRAAGGVGIGTNAPEVGYQLHVNGLSWFDIGGGSIALSTPGGWPGVIMMSPGNKRRDIIIKDNSLHLVTSNSNIAPSPSNGITILNDGSVGIGTDWPNYTLDVRGTIGNNTALYHSDRRWKTNIETIPNALEKVSALRGVNFEWRREDYQEMNFPAGRHLGVIAQEIETVLPELVHTTSDGYKSVEYANLTALLIEAVKEQQQTIRNLEAQIIEIRSLLDQQSRGR